MMFTVFLWFCLKLLLTLDPQDFTHLYFPITLFPFPFLLLFFFHFLQLHFFLVSLFCLYFCFKRTPETYSFLLQKLSNSESLKVSKLFTYAKLFEKIHILDVERVHKESYDFKDVLIFQLIFFNLSYFS